MHPLLVGLARRRVSGVIALCQFLRNWQWAHANDDAFKSAGQKIPEIGRAIRVNNGHIENGLKLVTHRIKSQRNASRLGFEQVLVGRLLSLVFGCCEARALQEVHHTGGDQRKFFACLARGGLVLAPHLRVLFQELFAVTAHEWELQCPPGQAHHGHPDQLLFEEKFEQGNAPVEQMLQHQNVHPGLVVAIHQVPTAGIEFVNALHIPSRALGQAHPATVAGDPGLGDT